MIEKDLSHIYSGTIHSTDGSPDRSFIEFVGDEDYPEDSEKIESDCDPDVLLDYIAYCESQIRIARKYLQEKYGIEK